MIVTYNVWVQDGRCQSCNSVKPVKRVCIELIVLKLG